MQRPRTEAAPFLDRVGRSGDLTTCNLRGRRRLKPQGRRRVKERSTTVRRASGLLHVDGVAHRQSLYFIRGIQSA
ncbi:unnamed protein product [Pylaiella littoralis]